MKKTLLFAYLVALSLFSFSQENPEYQICKWYENKKAAVSLTFDDSKTSHFNIVLQKLNAENICGTFFTMTSSATINWDSLRSAAVRGHEIAGHGITDKNWATEIKNNTMTESEVETEMVTAKNSLESQIRLSVPNYQCLTIAWPQGGGGGSKATASEVTVRHLGMKHYLLGARNAGGAPDAYNKYLNSWFEFYWYQVGGYNADGKSASSIGTEIRNTIASNGILPTFMHEITNASLFNEVVDTIKSYQNNIWITTFSNIVKYHQQGLSMPELKPLLEDSEKWVLSLTDTLSRDSIFNHPLTIRLKKPSFAFTKIEQNGNNIPFISEADSIQFNALPDGGNIVFTKSGVENICKKKQTEPFEIYPNPATNYIIINNKDAKSIIVYDATGTSQIQANLSKGINTIDISKLSKGLYFVKCKGKYEMTQKLIVK